MLNWPNCRRADTGGSSGPDASSGSLRSRELGIRELVAEKAVKAEDAAHIYIYFFLVINK